MEAGLYIVPTPIGHLADITRRGLEVLAEVDLIAAEDTRHSRKLLNHYDIATPLVAYHEHSTEQDAMALVARIRSGESVALISDAGTPLVSDPGYRLVRLVQDAHLRVVPLPGACAAIAALSASGLPTDRFLFDGFLPAKAAQRRARLQALSGNAATLVFYEAPHRIADTLQDAVLMLGGEREAVLARELSKAFETVKRLPLGELASWVLEDPNQQRGEQVLLIAGAPQKNEVLTDEHRRLLARLSEELPPRKAAAVVADVTGAKARDLYALIMASKNP